jgi:hypothetical protein
MNLKNFFSKSFGGTSSSSSMPTTSSANDTFAEAEEAREEAEIEISDGSEEENEANFSENLKKKREFNRYCLRESARSTHINNLLVDKQNSKQNMESNSKPIQLNVAKKTANSPAELAVANMIWGKEARKTFNRTLAQQNIKKTSQTSTRTGRWLILSKPKRFLKCFSFI